MCGKIRACRKCSSQSAKPTFRISRPSFSRTTRAIVSQRAAPTRGRSSRISGRSTARTTPCIFCANCQRKLRGNREASLRTSTPRFIGEKTPGATRSRTRILHRSRITTSHAQRSGINLDSVRRICRGNYCAFALKLRNRGKLSAARPIARAKLSFAALCANTLLM